jgi:hypothetical protein
MQIKTTLRFHLTSVRLAIIEKTTNAGEDGGWGGRKNPYILLAGIVNYFSHYGKQYGGSSKAKSKTIL